MVTTSTALDNLKETTTVSGSVVDSNWNTTRSVESLTALQWK